MSNTTAGFFGPRGTGVQNPARPVRARPPIPFTSIEGLASAGGRDAHHAPPGPKPNEVAPMRVARTPRLVWLVAVLALLAPAGAHAAGPRGEKYALLVGV